MTPFFAARIVGQRLHCKARPILVSRDDEKNAFTVGKRYALQLKMKMIAEVFALYKEKRCNREGGKKLEKSR